MGSEADEFRPSVLRRHRVRDRLARYVRDGHSCGTLLAYETADDAADSRRLLGNPPFVQYAWRDDLRLQIEVQGDQFRGEPYSDHQRRLLRDMGFAAPFEAGDDFCNWTHFREAEGCEPRSAAKCMIDALWWVYGINFHPWSIAQKLGTPYWHFQWNISSERVDIEAELRRRLLDGDD